MKSNINALKQIFRTLLIIPLEEFKYFSVDISILTPNTHMTKCYNFLEHSTNFSFLLQIEIVM